MRFRRIVRSAAVVGALVVAIAGAGTAPAASSPRQEPSPPAEAGYWTEARREAAQPRDLVLDERGLAYLDVGDGTLRPYGHSTPAQPAGPSAVPTAKPTSPGGGGGGGKSSDTTGPSFAEFDPGGGEVVGAIASFSAKVTDPSGIKAVTIYVDDGTTTWSFTASSLGSDRWGVTLQGLTDGPWSWWATATDGAKRGGNLSTSDKVSFSVSTTSTDPGTGGDVVTNAAWSAGGEVQAAAGRIYFEMPSRGNRWSGYVCSGTVVTDATDARSVILTAAHCVYDDANKTFARNVLFIPDQAASGTATDRDCTNDLYGCWAPAFGVVDDEWTTRVFPDNIPWDYGFYVAADSGAHTGDTAINPALDVAVGSLPASFTAPVAGDVTHALGYSYSDDPEFMYCAEAMVDFDPANWWLANCGLSGGSSGGPWVQPMDATVGSGPIISVNSWGYSNQPGMAGPKLSGTSASCLFAVAKSESLTTSGGVAPACPV